MPKNDTWSTCATKQTPRGFPWWGWYLSSPMWLLPGPRMQQTVQSGVDVSGMVSPRVGRDEIKESRKPAAKSRKRQFSKKKIVDSYKNYKMKWWTQVADDVCSELNASGQAPATSKPPGSYPYQFGVKMGTVDRENRWSTVWMQWGSTISSLHVVMVQKKHFVDISFLRDFGIQADKSDNGTSWNIFHFHWYAYPSAMFRMCGAP